MATLSYSSDGPVKTPPLVRLHHAPAIRAPQTLPEILRTLAAIDDEGAQRDPAYYAGIANLGSARIRLAKALLRLEETERARRLNVMRTWARGESVCCYCMNAFHTLADVVESGEKLLHGECYREHDREMAGWIHSHVEITDAGRQALAEPSDAA